MDSTPKVKFQYIGFGKRLMAYNLDITVLMAPFILTSLMVENNTVLFGLCFVIVCLYHAFMESSEWQGTCGKYYSKIIVIGENGERISFLLALLRILLKFIGLSLLFAGFMPIYFRKDRRGVHDILLHTYVIEKS